MARKISIDELRREIELAILLENSSKLARVIDGAAKVALDKIFKDFSSMGISLGNDEWDKLKQALGTHIEEAINSLRG